MNEEFWKQKFYDEKTRQTAIRMAQSVNLAQNELLQYTENPEEIMGKMKEKAIKYYELLEELSNMLIDEPQIEDIVTEEIIIPKI